MKKNSKKEKINPLMTDQKKLKKIKSIQSFNDNEDETVIKKFIITVVVIALLIVIVYFFTEVLKKDEADTSATTTGTINYDRISVGTILNRPYEDYYVMVYNSNDTNAVLYSTLLTNYMQKNNEEKYIKIYYCDLDNVLNTQYYDVNNDKISNPKAKNIEEFDFGNLTLLKIENGKIKKYIEDYETIKGILK